MELYQVLFNKKVGSVHLLPTDNRLGIISIEFSNFEGIESTSVANVSIIAITKKSSVFSDSFSMENLLAHRLNIHDCMLDEGDYQVIIKVQGEKYTIDFTATPKTDLGLKVQQSLLQNSCPIAFSEPCDSSFYPYSDTNVQSWIDKPDAIDKLTTMLNTKAISTKEYEMIKSFIEKGFMIIEDAFDPQLIDSVNMEIDEAISKGHGGYEYGSSKRIEHLHLSYPNVNKIWLNTEAKKYLDLIFENPARPCQTLTFVFGSQQDAHQDAIHLTPFPTGYMCGMWIALQDIVPESGELIVYPGSHQESRFRMSEMACAKVTNGDWSEFGGKIVPHWIEMSQKYDPITYRPKKGTVLIWHENLLHAGSIRKNPELERRSIVIHYFAQGAVAYYDSTGLPGMAAPLSVF